MSFEEQVLQVIRAAMPSHAQFYEVNSVYSYYLFASWKLDDVQECPERMSKAIAVCLSHEATRDFATEAGSEKQAAQHRVADFLREKLARFDPMHSEPADQSPPAEYWFIDTQVLHG
ncbi:hypothetical protein [Niveibacterium terrae]|uniref:hypothetical protein n=1 Tax=Niveibacterium terrae TaxID=3373598 RepID=UPI003A91542B